MSIELEHLTKRFDGQSVVDDVSVVVAKGELFVMLGPSGSGKTTLLRMIAGLEEVDEGAIRLHGTDVTAVSPKDRGIGFVFQHYGLFRHMTVADNVEFALRVRRVPARRRRDRREELLQLVGLSGFADRYPRQLSGGQQQRVALARALAHEPAVLLLDEPFGALDARIRVELRQALRRIQQELQLTTVFVTHDQEEAFELADRMAVLRAGRLLEVGQPQELYLRPRSPFVATFLGAANLFVCGSSAGTVSLGAVALPIATEVTGGRTPRRMQVLLRPEDVEVGPERPDRRPSLGRGTVEQLAVVGGFERLRFRLPRHPDVRQVAPAVPFGADHLIIDATRPQHEAGRLPLRVGDEARVAVRRFHVLAPASLRLLVEKGAALPQRAAAELGRKIAARIHAHTTEFEDAYPDAADLEGREDSELGAVTESAAEGFDLAVLGLEPHKLDRRTEWLMHVRHHLLLVSEPAEVPSRFLVCTAAGEAGKADVRFAERLAWQLGAAGTLLTVLPPGENDTEVPPHVARFMEGCIHALTARGVVFRPRIRRGPVVREILAELEEGRHDLLVIGAPLADGAARKAAPSGIAGRLIHAPPACPLLIVKH